MNTINFLSQLRSLEITISLEGEELKIKAPKGVITPSLKAEIVQRKPEIIAVLQEAKTSTQDVFVPIASVDRTGMLPLSYNQSSMWFIHQLDQDNTAYNESLQLKIKGQLKITVLEQSIQEIIRRHESLRTAFPAIDGNPSQKINSHFTFHLPIIDLQTYLETEISSYITREVRQSFNLENGDLWRFKLLRTGADEYILLIIIHHIIVDGWSMGIFIKELCHLYQSFASGSPISLPELNIQYGDFVVWQQENITGEILQKQLKYWEQQLADKPPLLELPTDKPRPAIQSFAGATHEFKIDGDLTQQLRNLSQKLGVTSFHTLLTAFVVLLYRYTGQNDISVGCPIANRKQVAVETLIGFFVNTIVIRNQIENNCQFSELVAQIRQTSLTANDHQDVSFEQVVEVLNPERSLSYNPIFQVMFALENISLDTIELPDLIITPQMVERGISRFDLSLAMFETKTEIIGQWEYSTDLFTADTMIRMTNHLQTLLSAIVNNPDEYINKLPLLTAAEKEQILITFNQTDKDYPKDKCIHQLFEEQVKLYPDNIALVYENQQFTYQQLNSQANQLAHYLQNLGVKPDDLVGICLERSSELIISLLAIIKAGAAYLPLDPDYPLERLSYMIDHSQVKVILTKEYLTSLTVDSSTKIIYLDHLENTVSVQSQDNPVSEVKPENLAYVIYTSGSTGKPKGIQIQHQGLVNLLTTMKKQPGINKKDVFNAVATICFDIAGVEIYLPLIVGAKVVIITREIATDGIKLLQQIKDEKITIMQATPATWQMLITAGLNKETLKKNKIKMLCGGEALTTQLANQLLETGGELWNLYGPTETTIYSIWSIVNPVEKTNNVAVIPIGKPIANTQSYILDRYLNPLPIGVPGELHIGGDGLARGYLNRPELTAERFINSPFHPNKKLYKTGDLARYLPDGNIEYLGRIDNQVKIRGFRIELGEIETVLTTHSQITAATVVVREDNPNIKQLVAYIVTNEPSLNRSDLQNFLKQKLPDYMIPTVFVFLDALPKTLNGKIDRKQLPIPSTVNESETFIAPRTPTEAVLTNIWQEVLLLEKIGIEDNFFELGGDSILSIQIIARANQKGVQITTKQLFQYQTIAQLATVASHTNAVVVAQGLVIGEVPLTPIQKWFFVEDWCEPHYFNQAMMLQVPAEIKPELLVQSIGQLIIHHDALRMRFIKVDSQWQQINSNINSDHDQLVPFEVIDFSDIPSTEQSAAIEFKANKLQGTLNLATGPMLRVVLFNLGQEKSSRLLLIIQHLVVDGVSWRILLDDLVTAYCQLEQGKSIKLPAKTTSFQDWAIRQQNYGNSPAITQELNYWLSQVPAHIQPLPLDFPVVKAAQKALNTEGSSEEIFVALTTEETRILLQDVPAAYNTQINDILLTALVQTFYQWTGADSLLIDLEGHGREELFNDVVLSRTVGWFTTIYPVFLQLGKTSDLGENLKTIKEQLRKIPNRGIGYGILRYLCQNIDIYQQLEKLPQAEISFNYLGQFDQIQSEPILLGFAPENPGRIFSPKAARGHILDVVGKVVEGKLEIYFVYSQNLYRRETITHLANDYISKLKTLITHCTSLENGGYTPSDFPDVDLSQDELDDLLSTLA
jgi:amino acid adenylation domain-containing protein/non-ribosomal peptide synthase protein (TIGR01720 family)